MDQQERKGPPAIVTVTGALVLLTLYFVTARYGGFAVLSGVLAVICGAMAATAHYMKDRPKP